MPGICHRLHTLSGSERPCEVVTLMPLEQMRKKGQVYQQFTLHGQRRNLNPGPCSRDPLLSLTSLS